MKHIFVVNPKAGRQSAEPEIEQAIARLPGTLDAQMYVTQAPGDAVRYVRQMCSQSNESLRFYACGGDGTLNEVVNGAYGFDHAAVACYPSGSGNDFVKYYGGPASFLDIAAQLAGEETQVDLMRAGDRLAINMVHFGFDAKVARTMLKVRRTPLIGGNNAYYTGVVAALLQPMATACHVYADGELLTQGNLLLCTLACGQYVGGGFRCAPRSSNTDGLMEVCLAKPISRFRFVGLIGTYTKGTHLDDPAMRDIIVYRRARQVQLEADKPFTLLLDGELIEGRSITVDLLPRALRFVVPRGAAAIAPPETPAAP